jgi:HTH-type transcriptional regulator/antitoxin HigA
VAIKRVEELMDKQRNASEDDELDVLATLVDAYESKHYPVGPLDPLVAIEFWMEQKGMTRKDLEPMIGSRERVTEVLSGKKPLTLAMIRRLHAGLGVSVEVLVGSGARKASSKQLTMRRVMRRELETVAG